jgi:hypothetical protein
MDCEGTEQCLLNLLPDQPAAWSATTHMPPPTPRPWRKNPRRVHGGVFAFLMYFLILES